MIEPTMLKDWPIARPKEQPIRQSIELPIEVEVIENRAELPDVATLVLAFVDPAQAKKYRFCVGQFNMLYLYGIGEVPISVMGREQEYLLHTIKAMGVVSKALVALKPGARLGLRGPYGNCWPIESETTSEQMKGRDLLFITAGLGCAPVLAAIKKVINQRSDYGRLLILQGVKHRYDLLWQHQYDAWRQVPNCQVLLAASEENKAGPNWYLGMVTVLLERVQFDPANLAVMMCGPEPMLQASMRSLLARGVAGCDCYLSLERNMQCALGHCGHCQMGPKFVCRDGPIFTYEQISPWFDLAGY